MFAQRGDVEVHLARPVAQGHGMSSRLAAAEAPGRRTALARFEQDRGQDRLRTAASAHASEPAEPTSTNVRTKSAGSAAINGRRLMPYVLAPR